MALFRVIAAAALALPATAGATQRHTAPSRAVAPSPLTTAAAVASRYWGVAPCGGRIKVIARQSLAAGLAAGSDAWVTFASSLGAPGSAGT